MESSADLKIVGTRFTYTDEDYIIAESVKLITCESDLDSLELGATFDAPCVTCGKDWKGCIGHMGHMRLKEPVVKPLALKTVLNILKIVCPVCSRLIPQRVVFEKSHPSSPYKRILSFAKRNTSVCTGKECSIKREFSIQDGKIVSQDSKLGDKHPYPTTSIYEILSKIPDADLKVMGFPERFKATSFMYKEYLPVLPHTNRPTENVDKKQRPNYYTDVYKEIMLKELAVEGRAAGYSRSSSLLTYSDVVNKIYSLPSSVSPSAYMGEPTKSRLTKKTGLPRSNAMGKRSNFTARTVIGPSSTPFGTIMYPRIASKVSAMEVVTIHNKARITRLYQDGLINRIVKKDKGVIHPKAALTRSHVFQPGEVVYRCLAEGDEVIFVRQPTLHKHSLMGYHVRMWDNLNIGIPSANTSPHNADFDGDEGNIHKPVDLLSRAEIRHVSGCWNILIGNQFSKPAFGLVYNATTSGYLLSQDSSDFSDTRDFIVSRILQSDSRSKTLDDRLAAHGKTFDGRGVFSLLLPENFFYKRSDVEIKDGILLSGKITSADIGAKVGGIIHYMHQYHGASEVVRFLTEGQALLDWYLYARGFSVGYKDCNIPIDRERMRAIIDTIQEKVNKAYLELKMKGKLATKGELTSLEGSIIAAVNSLDSERRKFISEYMDETNPLMIMSRSGSKGSERNISEITTILGQQFVDNKRPAMELSPDRETGKGTRFLTCYPPGSTDILHRGFVDRSFDEGLTPGQFFAHMMSSRVGLINTAIGTASTGHLQRTIVKTLEDVRLGYNGTVCNGNGKIYNLTSFDGFDTTKLIPAYSDRTGKVWSPVDFDYLRMREGTSM